MFRSAARVVLRAPAVPACGPASKRLISTSPVDKKSRSWKGGIVRLSLAAGAVYYYNTSPVFAQDPKFSFRSQPQPESVAEEPLPTLDSVKPKIREQKAPTPAPSAAPAAPQPPAETTQIDPAELEEQAGHEAAFNEETGEINWDCPCLGGMAHGPCGEDFKAAFSCFVFSTEEPKGIDCIDKFQAMQNCFRQYPEVYGAELEDDEAPAEGQAASAPATGDEQPVSAAQIDASSTSDEKHARAHEVNAATKSQLAEKGELAESEELVPKEWHNTEAKNNAPEQTQK
ncbi:coiled-coil-helix-coiled-coil-helix domain-containing protein [Aspergillus saccharolyticus JOP 1030-1]|uniref:Mitochondrial intermembrane space import and assembly protein 40 n=1 Tax=Aspergillus saccharolyticus JOP 1030-1 TaxID=1450539 RepID=A0A318ZMR0_9EURO|nr:mitochondrial intermembrane space protein Mia40 [Aspergillus saccharolyticus JOP 1030-1]PYH48786.1 mitochondrial intermembrane space protein Mia40 [Aspergillus saccharolyticus JOP 1030-1]